MISIALPMVISNSCETIMVFTDRLFLAKLGASQMNASMLGGLSMIFMLSFFMGLLGYATAMTAQFFGAGEYKKCSLVTTQAVIVAVLAYPLLVASLPLMHYLFSNVGLESGQLGFQLKYFDILIYGSILMLLRFAINSFYSGIGRTKFIMIASFGAMVVNICVSYVLIFGKFGFPAMGIEGAAFGTLSGTAFSILILVIPYLSRGNRVYFRVMESFRFSSGLIKKLFRFGYPAGFEIFMSLASFNMIIILLHSEGFVAASAASICFNWDHVAFVPLLGVEIAVTSLVGRYIGAKDIPSAERAVTSGLKVGSMYSTMILVMFIFFAGFLVDVFRPENAGASFDEIKELAVYMIRVATIYIGVEAAIVVYAGALRGAGDTFWAMVIIVLFNWTMVTILYFMLKILHLPVERAWLILVLMFTTFPFLLFKRFRSGKWKELQAV